MKKEDIFSLKPYEIWQLKGLIMGFLLIVATSVALHSVLNEKTIFLSLLLFISLIWLGIWILKNKISKTKKGKLGIILCIHSTEPEVNENIRQDFVLALEKSLVKNNIGDFADIKVIPYHIALRFNTPEKSLKLLHKAKAEFILHGVVRKRNNQHVIDLTANVLHQPLNDESTKRFQKDISSAWVQRYKINGEEHIIDNFEMSSEITSLCSKYIIALAAYASYNFNNAEILFVKVKETIKSVPLPNINSIRIIRKNTTNRLNQIYILQMQLYLQLWEETRDENNITIMRNISNKVFGAYKRTSQIFTYLAIMEVVLDKNFVSALGNMMKIKKKHRDAVWHLNIGFLNACLDNENTSIQSYQDAIDINKKSSAPLQLEKISEFENFICWYMKENNHPSFLYYLLGVLNEHFKGDKLQAITDYKDFLDNNNKGKLEKLVSLATKRIGILKNKPCQNTNLSL